MYQTENNKWKIRNEIKEMKRKESKNGHELWLLTKNHIKHHIIHSKYGCRQGNVWLDRLVLQNGLLSLERIIDDINKDKFINAIQKDEKGEEKQLFENIAQEQLLATKLHLQLNEKWCKKCVRS